ncbi:MULTISPECIES: LysR substrate-binding domain-containing protein [unclassified Acidovorax]|uniref:LysR substrate-binding domain-containing protein n=1 Tax=unclassified Acidovorax TaxID=2684926 RepID=UPI000AFF10AD|nr:MULTISPECIES: LysR substrate-binding domain-containing protein [unclassified Acidovorax]
MNSSHVIDARLAAGSAASTPIAGSAARRLPPLNMLRAFEAAGRLLSVTHAARELSVTQSSVSHQIKALEEWLGVALVGRDGRRLALTTPGAALLPGITSALDLMAQSTAGIERLTRRNTLVVNATATLASQWLIPRLAGFCAQMPGLDVQLVTTVGFMDFEPAQYDVSIRCFADADLAALPERSGWRDVSLGAFIPDALTPVCSPALLADGRAVASPEGLARFTLLHSRSTPLVWQQWLGEAGAPGLQPAGDLVFDHAHLSVQAAIQGLGVALGNPRFLGDALASGLLVMPFADVLSGEKKYYWLRPARAAQDPASVAFCDWLSAA